MLTLPSDRGLECSAAISNLYPNRKPYMQSSNMFSDPHTSFLYGYEIQKLSSPPLSSNSLMFPVELNKLKVKLIIYTGWETSEIVDVIHDIKHIMGDVLFRLVLEMNRFPAKQSQIPLLLQTASVPKPFLMATMAS
ncbi:hypothetical protein NC651_029818 [Populus alba x Populus x berolinensis]|nr:hypothetical protein NC651_029804 [Populus alba x Populus x berolinensis]KAJ6876905.1 hypothetical protein NC651_029809 [Populus alba x Populus x berolinensis]KAJ6876917.1 hypothetical protein NC651_029818 [Populus alba x Populus x berolinensis]